MNNDVAVLTVAFNEPRLLPPVVRQFKKPYLEEDIYHMVLISKTPWCGTCSHDDALTRNAAQGADYVGEGAWKNQAEQFNWGLRALNAKGFKWAIICDADEYYQPISIKIILEEIKKFDREGQIRTPWMEVYWKLPIFRISNKQTDTPVIAIKTDQIFSNKRTPSLSEYGLSSAMLHHFSYVRSDEEMLKKIESFEHSNEFNKMEWYENVWKQWTPTMRNLHPVVPSQFNCAIYRSAPKEIIKNFFLKREVTWGLD